MKLSFIKKDNSGGKLLNNSVQSELLKFHSKANRHTGITQEDLEILFQFFKSYYGGKDNIKIREKILETRINQILELPDDFVYNLV